MMRVAEFLRRERPTVATYAVSAVVALFYLADLVVKVVR